MTILSGFLACIVATKPKQIMLAAGVVRATVDIFWNRAGGRTRVDGNVIWLKRVTKFRPRRQFRPPHDFQGSLSLLAALMGGPDRERSMRHTDIVIAGGGLAGSTAAAMLGRAGIDAILIDSHKDIRSIFAARSSTPRRSPWCTRPGLPT
jgi:hypothetical protein